jgi:Ser/Thr protein kinase RdoA (MazF antagonist)
MAESLRPIVTNSASSMPNVHAIRDVLDERLIADEIARHIGRRPVALEQRPTKLPRFVFEAQFEKGDPVIFKAEHDAKGDDAIALECWAMDRVREAGVPAPRVLTLDATSRIFPGRYAIFARTPGTALENLDLEPDVLERLLAESGRLLRWVHTVRVEGYGRLDDELFLRRGEVRGCSETWREVSLGRSNAAIQYTKERDLLATEELARIEEMLVGNDTYFPERLDARLLHGDFDRSHIFVDPATMAITGIIDFGDREAGHPAWDLAGLALWGGIEDLRRVLRGYASDEDERAQLLHRASVYLVCDMLRLIHHRHEDGRTGDALAVRDELSRHLATMR